MSQKFQKSSSEGWIIAIIIGVILFCIVLVIALNKQASVKQSNISSKNIIDTATELNIHLQNSPDAPKKEAASWIYDTSENEMGEKTIYAKIVSENTINMSFPYNGGSTGNIIIRKRQSNLDILFIVSKGQIDTDYQGTFTRVKIDDENPRRYLMNETSDGSTETIFFTNAEALLRKIKMGKRMVVEVPFYQNGQQQFVFNIGNLIWK